MRILLIGEFSKLHNSLAEGLKKLGHEVCLVSSGDHFKNFPSDFSTKPIIAELKLARLFRKTIYKLFYLDIASIEIGIRFYFLLPKFKNYDHVHLINEAPIQTIPFFERILLKKLFQQNHKIHLLCCGLDYNVVKHLFSYTEPYSILTPFQNKPNNHSELRFFKSFLRPNHIKTHQLVYKHIASVTASDLDYVNAIQHEKKYKGLIPNPVVITEYKPLEIYDKIIIFLGINRLNSTAKGIVYFEEALKIIQNKYLDKVEIKTVENLPYHTYITEYLAAHIVLDQVFSYDQGYNALEAMAKGKVVFTGADKPFLTYYNVKEDEVAINALPNVDYLVSKLSWLIENPEKIIEIGTHAQSFIQKEHHYIHVAQKYLNVWQE